MWWAAGAAVGLVLILAGAVAVWGRWDFSGWRENETQHQTFDRPITTLVFDEFRSGDIDVSVSESGKVEVQRELHWSTTKPVVTETWSGDGMTVTSDCGSGPRRCSIRYTVKVPASVALRVDSTSGNVDVRGITGNLRVKTTSGDVTVKGATATLSVTTTSGNMRLEDMESTQVEATASSGDVDMMFDSAPQSVSARTTSGNVTVMTPNDHTSYKVDVVTTSGEREVTVDQSQSSGRAISVHATSGDVTIGYR